MIRQSEGPTVVGEVKGEDRIEVRTHGHKDSALWAPTGWVHVEKDIDFSDPKVSNISQSFPGYLALAENTDLVKATKAGNGESQYSGIIS